MSLSSWALVMAHHRVRDNRARRLRLSGDGELRHAGAAARLRPARRPRRRLRLRRDPRRASVRRHRGAGADPRADRRRLEGRPRAAACLAAARASGGAEPRLGADERRDDQGRRLRLRAHRVRPARPAGLVVEHGRARARRHHRGDGRALRADAARPQAAARLSHGREHRHHLHRARPRARLQGPRHGVGGGARAHRRPLPRVQPFGVQEPAVLRRRRGAQRHRRARHGASRRPDPPHAADRLRVPRRLRGDLGAAAAQRLRLRMADLPGDPAQPAAAVMGPQVPGAGGRRAARAFRRARGRLFRQGLRRDLPRPRRARRRAERAQETDRFSLAAMFVLAALCLSPAFCPACSSTRWRRSCNASSATACRCRRGVDWLSIVPIAESRSSYNGLLVFVFMLSSGIARRLRDPPSRLRQAAPRRRPGTAAIPTRARRPNTPPTASPSRSAACSAPWCSARASTSRCRRPATRARRGLRWTCAI